MTEKLAITQTKIITPQRRREYLTRPRLMELLSELLDYRLIIIAAPAGYGKTSLLVDFAHQFDWPVCWLALEPVDKDFMRFLSHFIFSIKKRFPDFGNELIKLIETTPIDQINTDFLITNITNDIFENITEHFILVLDDYHLLQSSPKIDRFLSEFVQRADENCHIAITSRKLLTLPDLPLMVARSQVGGLSVEELAFQQDEVLKLYNQVFKKSLSSMEAKILTADTEGWITGLLLTSHTLKDGIGETRKVTRTSGIGLYEYLAQQVLDQQPQKIRDFLLNTSNLEEFDAEMCEAVIGKVLDVRSDWNALMTYLIQNNLFIIPVSDQSLWLRYHHLFRDFLQTTIQKERPNDARKIRLELANYFLTTKNWEKAIDIYEQLGELKAIANLLRKIGSEFIAKGKIKKLSTWLSILPEGSFENDLELLSIYATIAVNTGKIQEGRKILDNVIEKLAGEKSIPLLSDNLIRRSTALRVLGAYDDALLDAQKAIDLTKNKPSLSHLYSEALRVKGITLQRQGKLAEGLSFFEQAINICEKDEREEDTARILVELGATYEVLGQLSEAEDAYTRSLAYWQSAGDSIWQPTILNNLGVLQHTKGDFVNSFINFEKSMHYSQITGNQRIEGYSLASIGDLYRDLSALQEAEDAYQKALEIAQIIEDQFLIFYLKTTQARLSVAKKQYKKAHLQIRGAQTLAKKSGSLYEINKYRLEKGALDFWIGSYGKAIENLLLSRDFFDKEGHIEDMVRNQFFLFLSHIQSGELEPAEESLERIMDNLTESNYKIPCMSAGNEVRELLKPLQNRKFFTERISKIIQELDNFQKLAQKSRRTIRKQASVVPFAAAKIIIRTFGAIEVISGGLTLAIADWTTQTSRDLFLLFLAFPEGLTKEEVGVIFWPDSSPGELKLRFKNTIYRMRHAIGSEVVVFQDNYYLFNRAIDYEYDVQNFIAAKKKAEEAKDATQKIDAYQTAINVYQGDYLPQIDETWVVTDQEKYREMYINASENLALLFMNDKEFEKGLEVSQSALTFDPYNEPLYRMCMQIYAALGNKAAVSNQYEKCRNLLRKEIGADPSSETTLLYETLLNEQK